MNSEIKWIDRTVQTPIYHGMFLVNGSYVGDDFTTKRGVSMAYFDKTKVEWSFPAREMEIAIQFWAEIPKAPIR